MRATLVLSATLLVAVTAAWPSLSHADTLYGAIAFNKSTGAYGYSNEFDTRAGAEEEALDNCAGHCVVIVWVRNACAALAAGRNLGYGYGYHATRAGAESIAMNNCRNNDSHCAIKVWTCSGS